MSAVIANLAAALTTTVPAGALALGCGCLAPHDLLVRGAALLLAWICVSVPVGVLVGHCTLSEEPSLNA